MINRLRVSNFKSVKNLDLQCKRVNLFIGEPNVGKSNILESLSLLWAGHSMSLQGLVRFSDLSNLFYENDFSNAVAISLHGVDADSESALNMAYQNGGLSVALKHNGNEVNFAMGMNDTGFMTNQRFDFGVRPYFFKVLDKIDRKFFDFLLPPHGDNLFPILQTNKDLRKIISDFVLDRGLKLTFRQATSEIELSKEEDNLVTTYPYKVMSDTLQRIIFFIASIESNRQPASLIFEEPESNIFPYYTKYLAEKIAYSERQFFMSTHSPYFLQSLIQKTPLDSIQVNVVYMVDYKTSVRSITSKDEIEELIDLDSNVFLNLDKFLTA